jgi:hypothetical protein
VSRNVERSAFVSTAGGIAEPQPVMEAKGIREKVAGRRPALSS